VKIVIAGGSAGGMFASLMLARAGHEVLLLEREGLEAAPDVEAAASAAFRTGAPQIVQPHIIMARCRELLMEHLPDVYENLLAAGVAVAPLWTQMAPSLADQTPRPGDERFTLLMTRRSTFDWVLRKIITAEPGVTVRSGTRVLGLLARSGSPPHVTGVRAREAEIAKEVAADLVVDATGCRTAIDSWLTEIGARPSHVQRAECGIAYFSRHYRFRPGATAPGLPTTRIVAGLNEFNAGIWGADNAKMQMAVAPLAMDHRFRTAKDPAVFTAVLRTVPTFAAWLDALEPISDVFAMGGLHNTLRRLVVEGVPVATGLHALGDSVCTTNPTLGRGLSMALWEAVRLRDILHECGEDWMAQSMAMDAFVGEHIAPFYEEQARVDGGRMAMMRHAIFGAAAPNTAAASDRVRYAEVRTAAQFDPTAFRALWRIHGMVQKPLEVYSDPEVVARTREALALNGNRLAMAQPTRDELNAALGV
jgi:2-polyprenyl-6-methoxyphenol hydroxylase-like FAD-dependent oxidoreductase